MIEIMNLRNDKPTEPYDFKVDRTTPLGNRFRMRDESDRAMVCAHYDNHFPVLLTNKKAHNLFSKLVTIYREHGKLRLFCWCSPKRCHAETIKRELEIYI